MTKLLFFDNAKKTKDFAEKYIIKSAVAGPPCCGHLNEKVR